MQTLSRATRRLSLGLAALTATGAILASAAPAAAESDKERNSRIATYALGAGTVYALAKKKTGLALLGAAGTYYTYRQWKDAQNDRDGRWDGRDRDRRNDRDWRSDGRSRNNDRYDRERYERERDRYYSQQRDRDRDDRRDDRYDRDRDRYEDRNERDRYSSRNRRDRDDDRVLTDRVLNPDFWLNRDRR